MVVTKFAVPMPIVFVDRPGGDFWASWQEYVKDHLLASKLISEDDLHLYKITQDIDEAVNEVTRFYRNFHSVRYTRDEIVLRLKHKPTDER